MADTTFVANLITTANRITAVWLNVINNFIYRGLNPLFVTSTGSANAYVITLPATSLLTILSDGSQFSFKASFTNTGASTLTIVGGTSLGPYAIQIAGQALTGGEIQLGGVYSVQTLGSTIQLMLTAPGPVLGAVNGLTLSNNASDATNDIDIAVGSATDTLGQTYMKLATAITKRLDAAWAVGTSQGGLDTGAIANAVYHVWEIERTDTGVVDVLFSLSATAPTMPTSYDRKRRLGAIIRSGATILPFTQMGNWFRLSSAILDVNNVTNPGTSAVTRTLTVPTGVRVLAKLNVNTFNSASAETVYISELAATDQAASTSAAPLGSGGSPVANVSNVFTMDVMTNTSAQIRTRHVTGDANTHLYIATLGWMDYL